jgi:hypothetical protein
MVRRENPSPRRQHFGGKFFRCPFQYFKVPLEVGAPPQYFDASYAPACGLMSTFPKRENRGPELI